MEVAELSGLEYVVRTAYRALRAWYPVAESRRRMPAWELLGGEEKRAFREMIIVAWNEWWTNSRPPVLPSREPRGQITGKVSCFALLRDPQALDE